MTISDHKKEIKKIFREQCVHVTVNHSIDEMSDPSVGFHVTIRKRRTKDSKIKRSITENEAHKLLFNYAYSIQFVA